MTILNYLEAGVKTVKEHTGETVTQEDINVAATIIEQYAGLVGVDLSQWSEVKLAWLSRAVDWQAAFIKNNPDILQNPTYKRLRADDVSIEYWDNRDMIDIDSRALQCLRHLGGRARVKAVKSLRGATGMVVQKGGRGDPDADPPDNRIWRPLTI